jgi:hypothetical protein
LQQLTSRRSPHRHHARLHPRRVSEVDRAAIVNHKPFLGRPGHAVINHRRFNGQIIVVIFVVTVLSSGGGSGGSSSAAALAAEAHLLHSPLGLRIPSCSSSLPPAAAAASALFAKRRSGGWSHLIHLDLAKKPSRLGSACLSSACLFILIIIFHGAIVI